MTRINTNVSSLNAQKTLARSNAQLQQALTRLSTGLRINSGKDDPAGLIASEALRSDIVSTERAITNSERANQMIATADSALGQVSSLLNDIRGLVSEAANEGAMSKEQIDANQLQVDSSLEAIDRISQVTQFQGKRLLDGSLDFVTSGVTSSQISSVQIDQANFGTQSQISVSVDVAQQATKGQLSFDGATLTSDVVLEIGGSNGFEAFSFASGSSISQMADAINLVSDALGVTASTTGVRSWEEGTGVATITSYGSDNDIVITADDAGEANGNYTVHYTQRDNATTSQVTFTKATATAAGSIDVAVASDTAWGQADYTLNNAGVGVKINAGFSFQARIAGTEFNNITLVTHDIAGTAAANAFMEYNHDTKELHIHAQIGGANASSATNVVNSVMVSTNWVNGTQLAEIYQLFSFAAATVAGAATYAAGTNFQTALAGGASTAGTDLAGVNSNAIAANIRTLINNAVALGGGGVEATLVSGQAGAGEVTLFDEYALVGSDPTLSPTANNYLQFLAVEGAPDIRFAATSANQTLSYDLTTDPAVTQGSYIYLGGSAANSTFKLSAVNAGKDYDDVLVEVNDSGITGGNSVVWDPTYNNGQGKVTISADIAGSGFTVQQAVNLVNTNSYVNKYWHAEVVAGAGSAALETVTAATNLTSGGVINKGTLIVNLATDANGTVTSTAANIVTLFENAADPALQALGLTVSNAEGSNGAGLVAATTSDVQFIAAGVTRADAYASVTIKAVNGINAQVTITARNSGVSYNGVTIKYVVDASVTNANLPSVTYHEASKELEIGIMNSTTTSATYVAAAINRDATVSQLFYAALPGTGAGMVTVNDFGTLGGGVTETGTASGTWLLGNQDAGSTAVNGMLTFQANEYGSASFVSVKAIEGTFTVSDENGTTTDRDYGSDVLVRINGIQAVGEGLKATINTSALDLSVWIDDAVQANTTSSFSIVGGGAQFQLGPDVVSNQQARIGIASVSTATLGGVGEHGRLFQIRSGNAYDLTTDTSGAATIVEDVITQITTLRGRLGAFQKTTLQTNIDALSDTLEALTEAESSIRDADFAAESANLTRAQILVQSGISVLSIANQNPQNVLALLR
ncbi:MAG: flagellin [Pirellulales bacterium]|nr:flagellin [Pirellulales bacterium]